MNKSHGLYQWEWNWMRPRPPKQQQQQQQKQQQQTNTKTTKQNNNNKKQQQHNNNPKTLLRAVLQSVISLLKYRSLKLIIFTATMSTASSGSKSVSVMGWTRPAFVAQKSWASSFLLFIGRERPNVSASAWGAWVQGQNYFCCRSNQLHHSHLFFGYRPMCMFALAPL